jgi:glutathione S-transferase
MILIGQYDSPFVRRVGIALTLYGFDFEHQPLSVFSDAEKIRALHPLMRVPTLVLDDGLVLTDSHMMLDYLDNLTDAPMYPRHEPARHRALRVATLACGLAEKAVSLFYERRMHDVTSPVWEARCQVQIGSVLRALQDECPDSGWWFGDRIGHADIAVACAWRFVREAHPGLIAVADYPALAKHAARAEALAAFQLIQQDFIAPA